MVDEAEAALPADLHSTVTVLELQRPSVISEVVSSQPLIPHCAQSSFSPTPELPTKQTSNMRHVDICSSAQPEHTSPLSSSSSGVALSTARCNGSSSSGALNLFIEEIISHSKGKNRAPSIEVSSKGNVYQAADTTDCLIAKICWIYANVQCLELSFLLSSICQSFYSKTTFSYFFFCFVMHPLPSPTYCTYKSALH